MKVSKEKQLELDMKNIKVCLDAAKQHGLEVEVVYWALQFMKETPSMTASEAINLGFDEWVK